MIQNIEPVSCRICKLKVLPDDLSEHFAHKHKLEYNIIQGQLQAFDKEMNIRITEDILGDCTSIYVKKRLLQKSN